METSLYYAIKNILSSGQGIVEFNVHNDAKSVELFEEIKCKQAHLFSLPLAF